MKKTAVFGICHDFELYRSSDSSADSNSGY